MVRDGVANMVVRLRDRGFDPRKVGADSWESRCPAHRSALHALAITRKEFSHVVLECRSTENCQHIRIVGALGFTNDHAYGETDDWLISQLSRVPVQPAFFRGGIQPPHPNPLPGGARAISDSDCPTEREETVFSTSPPRGEVGRRPGEGEPPVPAQPRAELESNQRAVSEQASVIPADAPPEIDPPAETGLQLMSDGSPEREQAPALHTGDNVEPLSSIQVLSRLASHAQLFRSADGRFCTRVPVGDRLEIFGLTSSGFRDWLIAGFLIYQPLPPSNWAIRRVVGMLEAKARFNTGIPDVFVRVGQDGDDGDSPYFLDLGDPSGRAISISDQGWCVVDRPAVHFRRPEGLLPLPVPVHDGSIDLLRSHVNLTEPDFRLMIAWLTAAMRPVGPYPILVLNGEPAAGKSTLAKIIRLLIDPQTCPVLALPKSVHDLMATAVNGWLLVYENITAIAGPLSDCICQLAFGGGFASRALFTNDERSVIYAQRPVMLVGIDDFVLRGDLRDRAVFLHLTAIPKTGRRLERKIWKAFRADQPRILGGLLDAIVGGLHALPSVDLEELPRMADFAEWGEATSRGLGWGTDTFMTTYDTNRKEATELLLDDSTVANVLLKIARNGVNWFGTAQNLYQSLLKIAGKGAGHRWPKTISMFGNELRRIAPQLRLHGISINFERRRGERFVTVSSDGPNAASGPSNHIPLF
jgi:hypothetical protein